jgi:hypothetical protein
MASISLNLAASYERTTLTSVSERLRTWTGRRPTEPAADPPARMREPTEPGLLLERRLAEAAKAKAAEAQPAASVDPETEKTLLLLEKLFGLKGVRRFLVQMRQLQADLGAAGQAPPAAAAAQGAAGWGLEYDRSELRIETETASLSASGTLTLDDGSTLAFSLDWTQTHETVRMSSESLRLGDAQAVDPLALDLGGDGIAFAADLMPLDLDRDGRAEQVHRLGPGDAWLAWDRDGDGAVADGSELFGPATGQGFAELAALDADGNGLVDLADPAWGELGLWNGAAITPLAQAGIAAIATAAVPLPFSYKAADGTDAAQGRSGGVWLGTDGRAGAAVQVDLLA